MEPQTTHKPKKADVQRFVTDLESAIELRRQFYQVEMDAEFEAKGGTILYAADSNVLNLHFQSFNTRNLKSKYACGTFSGPANADVALDDRAKITQVVASYIIRTLSSSNTEGPIQNIEPLIMLPGHNSESRFVYDRLIDDFFGQVESKNSAKKLILSLLDELEKISEPAKRIAYIQDHEDELHKVLYGLEAPHDKFQEFNQLLAQSRLLGMKRAAIVPELRKLINPVSKQSVFLDQTVADVRNGEEGSAEWWGPRLSKRIPEAYLDADKSALSVLDKMNRILEKQGIRVVLLTVGDDIIELGRKYRPFKHSDPKLGKYSFSDLYIRHPRCYLSRQEILQPANKERVGSDISVWLDAMLSEVAEEGHSTLLEFLDVAKTISDKPSEFCDLARRALIKDPDLHNRFYEDWRENMSAVVLAHSGASKEARRSLERALKGEKLDRLKVLDEFETYVAKITEDSWNDFFFTAARSGYQLISIGETEGARRARSVPPLILRNMGDASKAIEYVGSDVNVIRYESEIHMILESLVEKRDHVASYISALCFASLFAHGGRWTVAKLLALRALEDSKRYFTNGLKEEGISITGREAAYLCAVAHRITARSSNQLDQARDFLSLAKEKLAEEEDFPLEDQENVDLCSLPGLTGLRFDAEHIATYTTSLFFEAREAGWKFDQIDGLEGNVRKLVERIDALLEGSNKCQQEYLRQSSCITLRSCAFSCFFILEKLGKLTDKDITQILKLLEYHLTDIEVLFFDQEAGWTISILDLYLTLYAASFSTVPNPQLVELNAIYSQIQTEPRGSGAYSVFPFDSTRFRMLSELIDSR